MKIDIIVLKSQLQKLINEQDDVLVLQAIYTLLEKTSLDSILKSKLTDRALKAEADISGGRVFTKEEIIEKTNLIGK